MATTSTNDLSRGLDRHNHEDHTSKARFSIDEMPLTVRDAARYLGVSIQTVYLWVERKQIPHLRVMGRNIRFLKPELEPFRAQFKTGGGELAVKHDGSLYKREGSRIWWMRYRDKDGVRQRESTFIEDWSEAQKCLRERLQARDNHTLPAQRRGQDLTFGEWSDFYLENFSKPPFRAPKTHEVNQRALKHLRKVFESTKLAELTSDDIEMYLRRRLTQRALVKTKGGGFAEGHVLKAVTVHQELRVVRRMLNVAVRKKFLFANPCADVEFPARVDSLFRPHYMTWSEQQKIEFSAPEYLRNVIRIATETGLRIYKELAPMKKDQLDLENRTLWIPDSKTPNGVAEVPLTDIAVDAFRNQLAISGPGPFVFPSDENADGHQKSFKTVWHGTLRRARVRYFRIYDVRSTYATRLSAGGVADEWVTQLLRQGDAKVFKKYSQMKLQMKREALAKLNRLANEGGSGFGE